jgi:hypothetical protein
MQIEGSTIFMMQIEGCTTFMNPMLLHLSREKGKRPFRFVEFRGFPF